MESFVREMIPIVLLNPQLTSHVIQVKLKSATTNLTTDVLDLKFLHFLSTGAAAMLLPSSLSAKLQVLQRATKNPQSRR